MTFLKIYHRSTVAKFSTTFTKLCGSQFSTSGRQEQKIAELRQYSVKPDRVGEIEQLFTKYIDTRYKYSKATGFWKAELGTVINKLVSIWEYNNLDERAEIRKSLVKNEVWANEFLPKAMNCLSVQENTTMYAAPWLDDITNKNQQQGVGIYELNTISMVNGGPSVWENHLIEFVNKVNHLGGYDLVGVWYNDIGDADDAYIMWRFKDFASKLEMKEKLAKYHCDVMKAFMASYKQRHSMILHPSPWSPLQ